MGKFAYSFIWVALLCFGLVFFVGCSQSPDLFEIFDGGISRYMPVTLEDEFTLTLSSRDDPFFVKTEFCDLEIATVGRILSAVVPYRGGYTDDMPPWEYNDPLMALICNPIITLQANGATYTTEIWLTAHHCLDTTFARVTVHNLRPQWFTVSMDLWSEFAGLWLESDMLWIN